MSEELKSVLAWITYIVTYSAVLIGIWALPWSVSLKGMIIVILILIATIAILSAKVVHLSREALKFKTEKAALVREIADLTYATDLTDGMVALFYSLSQPPGEDHEHHFFEIAQEYRIDGDDASYSFSFNGERIASGQSSIFRLKISGDTPVDAATLVPEAIDSISGNRLPTTFSKDDPYLKVIDVIFDKPLEFGDRFKINVSLRWTGTFPRARQRDYIFVPWGPYCVGGIERFIGDLSADLEIKNATLEEIVSGHRRRSEIQPKTVERRGRCHVSWVVSNPTALYLLRFEKEN